MHPAGLPPANSPFEAEDDHSFTTDAEVKDEGRMMNDETGRTKHDELVELHHSSFILLPSRVVGRHGAAPCSAV